MVEFPIPPEGMFWRVEKDLLTADVMLRLYQKLYVEAYGMSSTVYDYKPDDWPEGELPRPKRDERGGSYGRMVRDDVIREKSYDPLFCTEDDLLVGAFEMLAAVEDERRRREDVVLNLPPEACGVGVKSARENWGSSDLLR